MLKSLKLKATLRIDDGGEGCIKEDWQKLLDGQLNVNK